MSAPKISVKPLDYDQAPAQHFRYAKGRALSAGDRSASYMATFAAHLPARRPLAGIDLGLGHGSVHAGAGRSAFGGPIYGVEPSDRRCERWRRRRAQRSSGLSYLSGEGARIPRPDASADFVLMFLSFHHMPDQAAAAAEIARVLKPARRLILRSTFKERIPDHWWRRLLPEEPSDRGGDVPLHREDRRARSSRPPGFSTLQGGPAGDPVRG